MATSNNLIGLGFPPALAAFVGVNNRTLVAAGTSAGTATQIPAGNQDVLVFTGTSGLKLPQVGGDGVGFGAHGGDEIVINNLSGAAIQLYASNNAAGSAITIYGRGLSAAGTTGVSILNGFPTLFRCLSVSTWSFLGGSA